MFDVSEASGSYNMSEMQGWQLKYGQFKQPSKNLHPFHWTDLWFGFVCRTASSTAHDISHF